MKYIAGSSPGHGESSSPSSPNSSSTLPSFLAIFHPIASLKPYLISLPLPTTGMRLELICYLILQVKAKSKGSAKTLRLSYNHVLVTLWKRLLDLNVH